MSLISIVNTLNGMYSKQDFIANRPLDPRASSSGTGSSKGIYLQSNYGRSE